MIEYPVNLDGITGELIILNYCLQPIKFRRHQQRSQRLKTKINVASDSRGTDGNQFDFVE